MATQVKYTCGVMQRLSHADTYSCTMQMEQKSITLANAMPQLSSYHLAYHVLLSVQCPFMKDNCHTATTKKGKL